MTGTSSRSTGVPYAAALQTLSTKLNVYAAKTEPLCCCLHLPHLPHLCASYILALHRYATALLPQAQPHTTDTSGGDRGAGGGHPGGGTLAGSSHAAEKAAGGIASEAEEGASEAEDRATLQDWEWALNSMCTCVRVLEVQAVFERHFLPTLQRHTHSRALAPPPPRAVQLANALVPHDLWVPRSTADAAPASAHTGGTHVRGAAGALGKAAAAAYGGVSVSAAAVQTDGCETLKHLAYDALIC